MQHLALQQPPYFFIYKISISPPLAFSVDIMKKVISVGAFFWNELKMRRCFAKYFLTIPLNLCRMHKNHNRKIYVVFECYDIC